MNSYHGLSILDMRFQNAQYYYYRYMNILYIPLNDIVTNNINVCNKNLIADIGYYDNKTFIVCNKHKLNAYICRKKQSLFEHRNKFINRINNNTNKNRVKIEHMFATLKQNKSIALNYSKKN
jgi:hypothetical protein